MVLVAVALVLRAAAVGDVGFAEDEMNKLQAIRAYERGDYVANAEHPMLMKLLMFGTTRAASAWNARTDPEGVIAEETALRAPVVVAGALTVVPIFS